MSQRSVLNHSKTKRFLLLPAVILSVVVICLMLLYVFLRENPIMRIPNLQPADRLPDGYEWQLENGPDFYIYRAQRPGNDSSGVGIYFGNMPSLDFFEGTPSEDLPREYGRVFSQRTSWVVLDGKEEMVAHPFYRTTILEYRHSIYMPLKLHVWVYAEERNELEELLHSLENLRIESRP